MGEKQTIVAEELNERLDDPFVRSQRFGRLRWVRDESLLAGVLAMLACAVLIVIFLIGGEIGTSDQPMSKPNITVQEITLGSGPSAIASVADAADPVTEQQQAPEALPKADQIGKVDPGTGRELSGGSVNISQSTTKIDKIPVVTLPPAPAGGGAPGSQPVTGIFKIDKSVKSVVYVIDKSSSMAGGNLARVQAELIAAIDDLDESQSFSVVFFNHVAFPLGTEGGAAATGANAGLTMLPATDGNKAKAIKWIQSMRPNGGTNPFPAVMMGLGADPEKMMLLSDGEFSWTYVRDITSFNRGKASIDCIGFGETVRTLIDIAKQNKGRYWTAR